MQAGSSHCILLVFVLALLLLGVLRKANMILLLVLALIVRSPTCLLIPGNTREVPEESGLLSVANQCQGPFLFMAFFFGLLLFF